MQYHYSPYPNPYYAKYLKSSGPIFISMVDFGYPFDLPYAYLTDPLSVNALDSFHYISANAVYTSPTSWGNYTFNWQADNTGKVISGNCIIKDTSLDNGYIISPRYQKFRLRFNYVTTWVY